MMKKAIEDLREFELHHCPHCMECWPSTPITDENSPLYRQRDCNNACGKRVMEYHQSNDPNEEIPFLSCSISNDAIPDPLPQRLPGFACFLFFFFVFDFIFLFEIF